MDKCKVAVIGYGGMARGWHVPKLYREMKDEAQVVGIYDIDPQKQAQVTADFGEAIPSYTSLQALIDDSGAEVAIVAIPNDQHKPVCCALMDAGINVVCEKPVALNSDELEAMIACAEKNDVLFTVHQNRRWDEDYRIVKKLYDENTLGHIFNVESRVHGSRGIPGDWRNTKAAGGGMVLDWGIHLFDQIFMLTDWDEIVSVYAKLSYVTNEQVDDGFKALLRFRSGLECHVEVGTSNFIELPRWYVQGENGSAVIDDFNLNGKIVKVTDWEKLDAVPVATAAGLTKTMAPRTDETIAEEPLPRVPSDINDFYRNVFAAARGQEKALITHAQLRRTMRLMEAVFRSAATDTVITDAL